MRVCSLVFAVLLIAEAPTYRIDLTRYFTSPSQEASTRQQIRARARTFLREKPRPIGVALTSWLDRYDALLKAVYKHEIYLYLKSEENDRDAADARADESMGNLEDLLSARVDAVIASSGPNEMRAIEGAYRPLSRYDYFIALALRGSAHVPSDAQTHAIDLMGEPVLDATAAAYKRLRKKALSERTGRSMSAEAGFHASWTPFARHEDAFAAMLLSVVTASNGIARLRGFSGAPSAKYFDQGLSDVSVRRIIQAVRESDALRRYHDVLAAAAAKVLKVRPAAIRSWDLSAADTFKPPQMTVEQAIYAIEAAEAPMGPVYASQYARLLAPMNARVEICVDPACDQTGFSVGFAGVTSALFFGGYTGKIDEVRAVAHEAGHAVHREFMNEHQPVAVYNLGPKWMFESFAIFNELLLYEHLYRTASRPAERAYYLNAFQDDATFQVFGSAEETDLEAAIYRAVASGAARTATDLDRLTLRVFAQYDPRFDAEPDRQHYWARDALFYTDPLYDVNYLYAGLLALRYVTAFQRDPRTFSRGYVALLQNGFSESPAWLERRFLGIDLDDEAGLLRNAEDLIDANSRTLAALYCAGPAVRLPSTRARGSGRGSVRSATQYVYPSL